MKPVYRSNLFALIMILGQIIGSLFLSGLLYQKFTLPQVLVLSQVIFLIIPTVLYFIITRKSIGSTLRLNKITITDIAIVLAIAFLSQPVASFLSALTNVFFENTVNQVIKQINNIPYITQLVIIALTPAICEEVTMRGIVLSGYDNISGWKAAVMTGLIFGILHLNPQQFLYAFVLGILFAYLVRITNSIFSSMLCHFMFNGIQVTSAYVMMRLKPELVNDATDFTAMTMGDKISTLLPLFFSAVFFGWIVVLLVKKLAKINEERRIREGFNYESSAYSYEGMQNGEMNYLVRGYSFNDNEKVINAPFIATVIISVAFMVLVEILNKR
jgi:uncharacterized protein